ncbi:dimethylmenaquinone methyltransferase, partial [bacterium]|nr:dimethylmenaquinone methyltransferase [bacterium]
PDRALAELYRVIRPGGAIVILEFGNPGRSPMGRAVNIINRLWLRLMGGAITGAGWAYRYLSITSESFPGAKQLQDRASMLLPKARVRSRILFPGICYLCVIKKVAT